MDTYESQSLGFHFQFTFPEGAVQEFFVNIDAHSLNLIAPQRETYPEWAALSFCQCPNCPLSEERNPVCPIAASLTDVIQAFQQSVSYENVDISIETDLRTYSKHTSLQKGLSSLLGIYMVTSGCPLMEKLKPMVRYHLPFAGQEETQYRIFSMYLLAQYFLYKRGQQPDWDLKKLVDMYQDIKIVNKSFSQRLTRIHIEDASLNALAILDWFAEMLTFSIHKHDLDELESLFRAYFNTYTLSS